MRTFIEIKEFLSILTKDFAPLGQFRHSLSLNEGKLVVTVPSQCGVFSFSMNETDLEKSIEDLSKEILTSIHSHVLSKKPHYSS
jgi:hypothetical protein